MMNLKLSIGKEYKYTELMAGLEGGSHQFYLPYRGQRVFAAFLNKAKNPKAPSEILVGSRRRVVHAALLFLRQIESIPIFVKKSKDKWLYEGHFRCISILETGETAKRARQANRADVTCTLVLEKYSNEEQLPAVFMEGRCGQATRNVFERSPEARSACLQHHGYRCAICDMLFAEEYGLLGENFIHVHHLRPLHKASGETETDPIKDLRPLCANCHAIVHAGNDLHTIDEIDRVYWSEESKMARKIRLGRA